MPPKRNAVAKKALKKQRAANRAAKEARAASEVSSSNAKGATPVPAWSASCKASIVDADDEGEGVVKRRRGGEIRRDWKCTEPGCEKDFKSVRPAHVAHD